LLFNEKTIKYNNINFTKYNFIIILYYYVYFIYKCLSADINSYNSLQNTGIFFGDFIKFKYSTNIYYGCINGIINIFNKIDSDILLDFSIYYYSEFDQVIITLINIIPI
jgi:hypothetical protein